MTGQNRKERTGVSVVIDDIDYEAALDAFAARSAILRAVGELAERPLDEEAAEQMREALAHAESDQVRQAIGRLLNHHEPQSPVLRVVPTDGDER